MTLPISVRPLNSSTVPVSATASPTATSVADRGLAEGRKTKTPSEVAGSPSPAGSCRKKPDSPGVSPTTTPVVVTLCPANGLVSVAPCTAGTRTGAATSQTGVGSTGGGSTGGGLALLRGVGAPTVKSVAFASVSAPSAARSTAVLLDGAGAGPVPSKEFAVAP